MVMTIPPLPPSETRSSNLTFVSLPLQTLSASICLPRIQEGPVREGIFGSDQILLTVLYPLNCKAGKNIIFRVKTSNGGILPLYGSQTITPRIRTRWTIWLNEGFSVQVLDQNQWKTVWRNPA